MAVNQLGDGSTDGVVVCPAGSKVVFYGSVPVVQRAANAGHSTSALAAVTTGSTSQMGTAINNLNTAVIEILATLKAYGLISDN